MKKIAFIFMAMFAVALSSCNNANKSEETVNEADSTIVAADSMVIAEADTLVEAVAVDSALVVE